MSPVVTMGDSAVKSHDKKDKMYRLREAVGTVLVNSGFEGLGVNSVAREAGVDKVLVYRYFDDLPSLVLSYCRTVDFWPDLNELLGPDPDAVAMMGPPEQMAFFFKSTLRAIRRRPNTMKILVWRQSEDNVLARQIDEIQMRSALEFFEQLENIPVDPDLTAVVLILSTAIFSLLCRSQTRGITGGIDLTTEDGWRRIEDGIDELVAGSWFGTQK